MKRSIKYRVLGLLTALVFVTSVCGTARAEDGNEVPEKAVGEDGGEGLEQAGSRRTWTLSRVPQ